MKLICCPSIHLPASYLIECLCDIWVNRVEQMYFAVAPSGPFYRLQMQLLSIQPKKTHIAELKLCNEAAGANVILLM